jgi:hypothetical protein
MPIFASLQWVLLYPVHIVANAQMTGSSIGFAGAAWDGHPNVEMLSVILPLAYDPTNLDMQITTARHFRALKNAVNSLHTYYDTLTPDNSPDSSTGPSVPISIMLHNCR